MIKNHVIKYFDELREVMSKIQPDRLEKIINLIMDAYKKEKQIFIFGNGGSAATASHFACDMNKCASMGLKKKFKVICLNDSISSVLAYANDMSYADIFAEQLKNFLKPGDLVIGISGSGNSENVLKAIKYANKNGAKTIGLSGFNGGKIANVAQFSFVARINDMQKIEDVHLVVCHIIMKIFLRDS